MSGIIRIVGIGPGNPEYVLPAAVTAINRADVLIGGKRLLEQFIQAGQEALEFDGDYARIGDYITRHAASKQIVILASGDPGIFSIQKTLRRTLSGIAIETVPGISALQYFCAKLGTSWDDLRIISLHGRDDAGFYHTVRTAPRICVFTGGNNSPDAVCRRLQAEGLGNVRITVGERLSYPEERIVRGDPTQIGALPFDNLAIMLIENDGAMPPSTETDGERIASSGLPDDSFRRGDAPMTKAEIRAITLSKLQLRRHDVVCDIGAGTGSVAVEAARLCAAGTVYAIEKDPQAVELVRDNVTHFGLTNVQIINGTAPEALAGLPGPDRVFVGGSDGRLPEVIRRLGAYPQSLRVVINAVTLETTCEALQHLTENGFANIETIQVAISRSQAAGAKHIMKALNPVTIISADKAADLATP